MAPFQSSLLDEETSPRYKVIADRVASLIERGTFHPGDRLPSVRELARDWEASITTIQEAYRQLENRGLIEARPQSGHYVATHVLPHFHETRHDKPHPPSDLSSLTRMSMRVVSDSLRPDLLQFGVASPDTELLPAQKLHQTLSAVCRRHSHRGLAYDFPPGNRALRAEAARRAMLAGCALSPEDFIVISGCLEAVMLALQALCKPGDAVALESPVYFGFIHALDSLGLRALEIPVHPRTGMNLDVLAYAIDQHRPKAVLSITNFHNPMGCSIPDEGKRRLVELLEKHDIPLIEDDLYGELPFAGERPHAAKAHDRTGNVIYCTSVSKTLAPGYRVGWIAPGKYYHEILRLKTVWNLGTALPMEYAVADFLANGGYDHHLRRIRKVYARRAQWLAQAVDVYFPKGTCSCVPAGGFVLWVRMPEGVDSLKLYERCVERGVTIAPGAIFSPRPIFTHCIRINAALAVEETEPFVKVIAEEAGRLLGGR